MVPCSSAPCGLGPLFRMLDSGWLAVQVLISLPPRCPPTGEVALEVFDFVLFLRSFPGLLSPYIISLRPKRFIFTSTTSQASLAKPTIAIRCHHNNSDSKYSAVLVFSQSFFFRSRTTIQSPRAAQLFTAIASTQRETQVPSQSYISQRQRTVLKETFLVTSPYTSILPKSYTITGTNISQL